MGVNLALVHYEERRKLNFGRGTGRGSSVKSSSSPLENNCHREDFFYLENNRCYKNNPKIHLVGPP
jgi:hypothetical protein